MSSFAKSKLKEARDALAKKNYPVARDAARQILDYEPDNYNANVFLGLAALELGDHDQSEQAYRKAIDLNPAQTLAWQGISKFYERNGNTDKYVETLEKMAQILANSGEVIKCAETVQKLITFRREHGSRNQLIEALSMLLPESPLHTTLSNLPPPDPTNPASASTYDTVQSAVYNYLPTLEEIVSIAEKEEDDVMKKEVKKRRMRLGAPGPEQLKKEVGCEIWGTSPLPALYTDILNHPNTPDDLRRSTEAKLLRHKQRHLYALPLSEPLKASLRKELDSLVDGAVVLGIPDELAWSIFVEGKDTDTIDGYDFALLQQFTELFPLLPLSRLLKGYFIYNGIPLAIKDDDDEQIQAKPSAGEQEEDPFDTILDAFASCSDSILANRIVADTYLQEQDYQNAIRTAEVGLTLVGRAETNNGRKLSQVRKAFNVVLATALVHLFPPKHHVRALGIIDEVLAQDPDNIACLMGRAYILQHAETWPEAAKLFGRVAQLAPDDMDVGLRAKEEQAWCQVQIQTDNEDDTSSGKAALQSVIETLDEVGDRDDDKARCLWKLGKCYWALGDEKRDEAYRLFITALKHNPSYAPAFTSLGVHYAEFATPPDPTRASKCFQKAFELDAREAEAARRLAEGFADEREWDLVEVVARRTIDGEGGLDAGLTASENGAPGAPGRYLPTNAWAWKAVGVVELTRRNYPPAIQAFQIALRADPDDHLSWLRLGESYSRAGRHVAAVKALARAHELQPSDWITTYFIGEVQRQMGDFQQAINSLESILADRPSELGILIALGQTHLELGLSELATGFMGRAEESFLATIDVGLRAIEQNPGFRGIAWKSVADAVFCLSRRSSFVDSEAVSTTLSRVAGSVVPVVDGRLSGILPDSLLPGGVEMNGLDALAIALASYDYRISLVASDDAAVATAWYDFGAALHLWSTKVTSSDRREKAEKLAVSCLTSALRGDPGNDAFWNAFGNAHFVAQPKTAQHAFIKALEIDSKNVTTWTNLGLLYLQHDDFELANQAFYRAQTLDPDYTLAWIGQGLVATANGHDVDSKALFEHAVGLTADIPEADLEFATRLFSRLASSDHNGTFSASETAFPAFFVLDRYCKQRPDDATALHLFGLVCERLGHTDFGIDLIQRAITILEAAYEETEDTKVERQFTIANSNLARMRLAVGDYEGALESFESALGLLPDDDVEDPATLALRVQAQFGSGIAHFRMGDLENALTLLEAAVEIAGDAALIRGQVTVLLAQTLWALGTDELRDAAKAKLLECITVDPENLAAINALAGMGILTEDDSLVDAALSEILSLPLDKRRDLDKSRDVNHLLIQHHLVQGDPVQALSVAQKALFAEPALPEARRDVATLTMQRGEHKSALATLGSAAEGVDDVETLRLRAIAEGSGAEALRLAQRAVRLRPWQLQNWQAMAFVRTQNVGRENK